MEKRTLKEVGSGSVAGGVPGRFGLLALDFDGTMRSLDRPLSRSLMAKLARVRRIGVRVVLVTGRCILELERLVDTSLFDAVVAENGTILLVDGKKRILASAGWRRVRARLAKHFEEGCEEVVISVDRGQSARAARLVRGAAKMEFNKNRIMIMPKGLDKGSGLAAAVGALGPSGPVICVGDGENDLSMFRASDYRVALDNSVEALKKEADYTASLPDGEGTVEAIDALILSRNAPRSGKNS